MRAKNEKDILSLEVRKTILEEIQGNENQARKRESYRRYLCYKDLTKDFVIEQLLNQFDADTVRDMQYCISNVSFVRKIIDKLARVYNSGVTRVVMNDPDATATIGMLEKELDFNTHVRLTNKFLKLQKNVLFYVKPCPVNQPDGSVKYTIKTEPLNPYLYDVVEDYYDRTKPMAVILSDFDYQAKTYTRPGLAESSRGEGSKPKPGMSNGKDEIIADSPEDKDKKEFIWWTPSFHFTTNEKGEIVSGPEIENPIGELPFENFAIDQDGSYWAIGGNDLIDGSILLNSVLTHNQHVAITQGYGQFYMRGKNLPRNIKVGPSKAILMEYQEGEPAPELGFATASPQIDALRGLVESYIALMLTTNNLSTSSVAASLSGQATAPSGIAMLIDKSESMEDVNDQRQIFVDKEPAIWRKINKWLAVYNDLLVDGLNGVSLPEDFEKSFVIKFHEPNVILSESERLANLKTRKELGIESMTSLIMKDNPEMSEEEARARLAEILKERMLTEMTPTPNDQNQDAQSEAQPKESQPQTTDNKGNEMNPSDIQKRSLNGAQVAAMVDVVTKVALGQIPRESGIEIITNSFSIDIAEAERIISSAGSSFNVAEPAPKV